MKRLLLAVPLAFAASSPGHATGGLACRTAGDQPVEVALAFGHVPGAPLILPRLLDNSRSVAVEATQWWLDNDDLRLVLVDPDARAEQVRIKAARNGFTYDGSLWRDGKRRWVRCRED